MTDDALETTEGREERLKGFLGPYFNHTILYFNNGFPPLKNKI